MSDMHCLLEIKMRGKRCQVVGVMIHVMTAVGLGGTPVSAPIVGDDAKAMLEEEHHLVVPIIGRQRPAVAEDDGLTFAPVLVINLSAVFRHDHCHWRPRLVGIDSQGYLAGVA